MSDVFISHSSKDAETANKVCKFLEDKGLSCWIAPRDIVPGADWAASISTAITASKVFLVIYSANCAASTQVPREIGLAESKNGVYTIPYRIDDTPLTGAFEYYLTNAHWVNANYEKNDFKLEELYAVISAITGKNIQNITNNTYIDNLHIHNEGGTPPENLGEQINSAVNIASGFNPQNAQQPVQNPPAQPFVNQPAPVQNKAQQPQVSGEKKKLPLGLIAGILSGVIAIAVIIAIIAAVSNDSDDDGDSSSAPAVSQAEGEDNESSEVVLSDNFDRIDKNDFCTYSALLGVNREEIKKYFGDEGYHSTYAEYDFPFLEITSNPLESIIPVGTIHFEFDLKKDKVTSVKFSIFNSATRTNYKDTIELSYIQSQLYNILEAKYGYQFTNCFDKDTFDSYSSSSSNQSTGIIKEEGYPDKRISISSYRDVRITFMS